MKLTSKVSCISQRFQLFPVFSCEIFTTYPVKICISPFKSKFLFITKKPRQLYTPIHKLLTALIHMLFVITQIRPPLSKLLHHRRSQCPFPLAGCDVGHLENPFLPDWIIDNIEVGIVLAKIRLLQFEVKVDCPRAGRKDGKIRNSWIEFKWFKIIIILLLKEGIQMI